MLGRVLFRFNKRKDKRKEEKTVCSQLLPVMEYRRTYIFVLLLAPKPYFRDSIKTIL
jgi:hypothetical protein